MGALCIWFYRGCQSPAFNLYLILAQRIQKTYTKFRRFAEKLNEDDIEEKKKDLICTKPFFSFLFFFSFENAIEIKFQLRYIEKRCSGQHYSS